nr:N-6 DNA methylase [Campylobacter sp. RM12327]
MYRYGFCVVDSYKGSGSLLIKTTKEIKSGIFRLYGQEKNSQTHALCRMNMFLHEINDSIIEWGDTLRNPLHLENGALKTFDIVIANPPFSLDKWGEEEAKNDIFDRFKFGIPPKSKGDYAFVLHMISSLNQNGTMGVILPHGVLFRGSKEGKIRQKLIEKNLLDAVIGLPANLFFGTSIPACIMIFKKNRSNNDIFFIDASKDYEKDKNQNTITKSHIEKIVNAYTNLAKI